MIRLFIRSGLLGQNLAQVDLQPDRQLTPRLLLEQFSAELPKSLPVQIAVDGAIVQDAELDRPLQDGQQVVLLPETGEVVVGALVQILYMVLISAAISYAAYLLSPRPKPPGLAQQRGDDSSSTYSWDGIKTSYGPGQPIAWGYGRHAVGGQVIWMDAAASRANAAASVDDRLRLILSLMGHRIHRIGDLPAIERNELGGIHGGPAGAKIPAGLRINGNLVPDNLALPGVRVWTRPGTQDQTPLPAPFVGVRQLFSPNLSLNEVDDSVIYTWSGTDLVSGLSIVLTAPNGIYQQDATGAIVGFEVLGRIEVRKVGSTTWSLIRNFRLGSYSTPTVGFYAQTTSITLYPPGGPPGSGGFGPTNGPLEFRLTRTTPSLGTSAVSQVLWRDLVVASPHTLRYGGEALLAIEAAAGPLFAGGQPQILQQCDLCLVRVWDATNGWSPRCWDVPPPPFDFNVHPPGRNPAWILLDYLLAPHGLGRWLDESKIDLQAFRNWAAFCDQDPHPEEPWDEPAFRADLVGDSPKPSWEWVMTIAAAGRAVPLVRNGKISVVYQYRDEHYDAGGGGAPAKSVTQLINAANCEDVQVTWSSKSARPTVLQFQFLNEEKGWEQDTLQVPDLEGTLHDPTALRQEQWRSEDVQAYGVTRASQLYREGVWRHRIGRLVRREISFVTGPWALAAEVGDLIDFQDELLRPFADDVPAGMQVLAVGAGTITVDHQLSGTGLQVIVRAPTGFPQKRTISSYTNNPDGTCTCTLAGIAIAADVGATCVIGKADKLVETYQIVSITLQKDLKRQVRAVQWTPEAYDLVTEAAFLGFVEEADGGRAEGDLVEVQDDPQDLPPNVLGVAVVAEDSGHLARWTSPGGRAGGWAAVYVRELPDGPWQFAGRTDRDAMPLQLRTGERYRVSVCLEGVDGSTVPPDSGDQVEFAAPEFPPTAPPAITGARVSLSEDELLVEWDDTQQRTIDYVEVRAGTFWTAGRVLARERAGRVFVPNPPVGVPLLVAPRARSGLYGPIVELDPPAWAPPNTSLLLLEDDLTPSPAGTHDGTSWNGTDGVIELPAEGLAGTYTGVAQDLGYQAPFYWQVRYDAEEHEDVLVSELAESGNLGESLWRLVSGRPASPASPGLDWRTRVQDLTMPVGDLPGTLLARGFVGVVGSHTQVEVESRFYVDGAWTPYRPHTDRVVLASRMQVRLHLGRRTTKYRVRVPLLSYAAYL